MDSNQPREGSHHPHPSTVFASLRRKSKAPETPSNNAQISREARDLAVREAKKFLLNTVRDDWYFESTPAGTCHTPFPSPERLIDAQEWRERDLDTSCSETEPIRPGPPVLFDTNAHTLEYADRVELTPSERKRKRRRLLENEMKWNEGLRNWTERRNAWTGATINGRPSFATDSKTNASSASSARNSNESGVKSHGGDTDVDMIGSEQGTQSLSSNSNQLAHDLVEQTNSTSPSAYLEGSAIESVPSQESCTELPEEPLIPIVQPILPDSNPVRATITPSIYPSIYSKVVVQSLTPAIPINLADVTKSLVQGWKADGEWPPKPSVVQDTPVVKKRPGVGENTGKIKRLSGSGVTGAVKKVLGFSGIHSSNKFHIRSPSNSGANQPGAGDVNE